MKRSGLLTRKAPLKARTPLRQGAPLQRAKGVRKVNPERKARTDAVAWGDGNYARWLRTLGCLVCGRGPADCHHVRSRAAGGRESDLVPLCRACHGLVHHVGPESFATRYGVDLRMEADRLWLRWLAWTRDKQTMGLRSA